jgi:cytochrome c-type biogenesis protein CcmE
MRAARSARTPTSCAGSTNSRRRWGWKDDGAWRTLEDVMSLASLLWSFQGRISRGEFWLGVLLSYGIAVLLSAGIMSAAGAEVGRVFGPVIWILLLLPLHAKRYHDLGRSGWWALISFIPFGVVWTLIQCGCVQGRAKTNAFGPVPKGLGRKQRRLLALTGTGVALVSFVLPVFLVVATQQGLMTFFHSPTDVVEKHVAPGTRIRLGGLVKQGTLRRGDNLFVRFEVTDGNRTIPVTYIGILPDLFREGQGVVTEGALDPSGVFKADSVLAKHDENYMPKEVAEALKKQGHWKTDTGYGLAGESKEGPKK